MDFEDEEEVEESEDEEEVEESEEIQPLIGKRLKFSFLYIILFFVNILLICYELNTGFEPIMNEKPFVYKDLVLDLALECCHTLNMFIILRAVFAIGINIGSKFDYFGKKLIYFVFLSVPSFLISYAYRRVSPYLIGRPNVSRLSPSNGMHSTHCQPNRIICINIFR